MISHAIITHWHPDHIGGVRDLLSHCPRAKIHKHQPTTGQLDIIDGQLFQAEGATLRAFHCPGHTTDHMALILEEEDAMFTGDNVLGHGTAVFEDLTLYLNSLQRMRQQFHGRAYPAHGPVLSNGPNKIEEYIRHRHQREEEILHALHNAEGGDRQETAYTPRDLVRVIYKDVPVELHDAAEKGVVQVLRKLQGENRVAECGEGGGKWRVENKSTL